MYIPKINQFENKDEIVEFMSQFSFATIITSHENIPTATHLPFIVTIENKEVILTSHFAKANKHWEQIEHSKILVIFSEPHAYISPENYKKLENVPTWNYVSVHAYGQGELILESEKVFNVLEQTINNFEKSYFDQWNNLSAEYKVGMSKGIVAFKIKVTDLQAKKKLSQNRSGIEKENIINKLEKSEDTNEKMIANYMKKEN